jgi:nitrate/nitrite transporter NarK
MISLIWVFGAFIVVVGILVWFVIPDQKSPKLVESGPRRLDLLELTQILKKPAIWLNAVIVLCAYVGYKCTDDFSLYAFDTFHYNQVDAARVGTISFWIRPIAAIAAGMLADRVSSSKIILVGFIITIFSSLVIATGLMSNQSIMIIIANIVLTSMGIYGIRGVYFALFNEAKIPLKITGTAIGTISVIGFTPDIFMGPLMGYFLDEFPGVRGHQFVFGIFGVFSCLGLGALLAFRSINRSSE